MLTRHQLGHPASQGEVGMLVVLLRHRERGALVDDRLHRRAHGARVGHIVAEVGAVVDTRGDQVEADIEVAQEREADRIGGRTVDRPCSSAVGQRPLADPEWAHERLLVTDRGLVGLGRHHIHVTDGLQRLLEGEQAARLDAVVVGDEDARTGRPVAERPGVADVRTRRWQLPVTDRQRLAPVTVERAPLQAESVPQAVAARCGPLWGAALLALVARRRPRRSCGGIVGRLRRCPVPGGLPAAPTKRDAAPVTPPRAVVGATAAAPPLTLRLAASAGLPGTTTGAVGTRTVRPSRASTRLAARLATSRGPPSGERSR